MPGLVGIIGKQIPGGVEKFLTEMAHTLDPDGQPCIDLYHEGDLGLGRVSLGVVNPQPQPVWNEEKTICVVMEGELYDTQVLKENLLQRGYRLHLDNDPELILNLYQEFGEEFALKLNGAFVLAIWDRVTPKLLLVNDRLGLYPLYYVQTDGGLIFASGVRALLVDRSLPRKVDRTAIAEFLTFDHVLHQRTLLEDVHLFPQGSILTFQNHQAHIRPYFMVRFANPYSLRSEVDYMDEYLHLLQQAITRHATDDRPSGLLLSGGLDSRLLLAFLSSLTQKGSFFTFTWGIPGCDDARFAKELAAKTGVHHEFFELKPDWLLEKGEEAIRLTDGMGNLVNLHALATLDQEASCAKVLYKGFLGDAMMGFALRHQLWANYDETTRFQAHFQVHTDQGVVTFAPEEQKKLFTDAFQKAIGTSVDEDYLAGMDEADTPILADQRVYFDYRQRVPRMTIKGVEVARSKAMVRLPFADNDLVDFALRLPPGLRYERRLQRNAFIRAFPKLAQVPISNTGFPMMACARDTVLRGKEVIRWHLEAKGLGRLIGPSHRPYKDYNRWFRTVLRNWVEETLLSRRSLERGYFNPDAVRQMVSDHMAGADYAVRIGALMSLELWHRMFLD